MGLALGAEGRNLGLLVFELGLGKLELLVGEVKRVFGLSDLVFDQLSPSVLAIPLADALGNFGIDFF